MVLMHMQDCFLLRYCFPLRFLFFLSCIMSLFDTLPVEILEYIIRIAPVDSVQALSLTCRSIHRIVITYNVHWQKVYRTLYVTDIEDNGEVVWLEQTYRELQARDNNSAIWWQLLNKRHRLEACWRGQTSHNNLSLQFKHDLPWKRLTSPELFTRPGWILAKNGQKIAIINAKLLELSWLTIDPSVADSYTPYIPASHPTGKRRRLSKRIAERVRKDESSRRDVLVHGIALSDKYVAVRISTLPYDYDRIQVWRIADQQLIFNQANWGYIDILELRGRWLHYVECLKPGPRSLNDRLVVVDLEAINPEKSVHRLVSPVGGTYAHLQRASATEAELFHSYYEEGIHYWCLFRIIADDNDSVLKTMPLPPTKFYAGAATCIRVEHDHDQVLFYGRGDHQLGFTTWASILRLSDNKLLWERDVGVTPPRGGMDILQVAGGASSRCHYLVWPFGQQAVKILSVDNGDTIHFISLDERSVISMIGQPIIGTLVLIALVNSSNNTDQCLMLDVQSGELIDGPILKRTISNEQTIISTTATHLSRWDSKTLEVYLLCQQTN
ncbi:hypothetical protein BDF22DRAFT_685017 [Syncephalis plumigaleata]|nr:hypothetical protein BDF22DRAFT_685017 [Syncephalis plumigaleata]